MEEPYLQKMIKIKILSFVILLRSDAAPKMKFFIKIFFSKFTEEIFNGKHQFLCSVK